MAEDIFQDDDRVVDQTGKDEGQTSQDHHVHRVAGEIERDKSGERRQGDGEEDGHRGAHAAEENQDHESGQEQADRPLVNQVLDRVADKDGLVEDDFGHQLLWHVDQVGDRLLDPVDHRDRVRIAALFHHRQIDRGLPVDPDDVGLDFRSILGVADISDQHRPVADRFQRQAVDVVHRLDLAVGVEIVVERPDFHVAGRQNQIGFVHRPNDVHDAELMRLQLDGVDINHDLAVAAAEGLGHGSAGNVGDLVAHGVLSGVPQFGLPHPFALEGDQADRQAGGVELEHHGRKRPRRQLAQVGHGQVGDGGDRRIVIGARLEIHFDQAHAGKGARFDVIDPAAQGEKSLEPAGDVVLNLFWRHAGKEGGDYHHGNLDRWKEVHRHPNEAGHADHADDQAENEDEVRIAKGKTGHEKVAD